MNAVRNGKQVTRSWNCAPGSTRQTTFNGAPAGGSGCPRRLCLVGYKIHAKLLLVVRQDDDCIRRYVHLGTGNYNPNTARLYTDLSLLTCRTDFGEDATNLFNLSDRICQFQGTRRLLVAPFELRERVLALIRRETEHAQQGLPARIVIKTNALVDREIIQALYLASQAGVRSTSSCAGFAACDRDWPASVRTSPCAALLTGSWNTAGFITSRTRASRRCS